MVYFFSLKINNVLQRHYRNINYLKSFVVSNYAMKVNIIYDEGVSTISEPFSEKYVDIV